MKSACRDKRCGKLKYLYPQNEIRMSKNSYMLNMKKVLLIAEELHKRGYQNLRVFPSISPSGVYWRCDFIEQNPDRKSRAHVSVSNWIHEYDDFKEREIQKSVNELTNDFENEHPDFLQKIKDENPTYVKWYSEMLQELASDELPYAMSDYFKATDVWRTSENKEIKILHDDPQYY